MARYFVLLVGLTTLLLFALPVSAQQSFILTGKITDVDGKPVAGAEISVFRGKNSKKPADFASNRTTDNGKYKVALPAGQYWAVAVLRKSGRRFGPLELGDKYSGEAVELEIGPDQQLEHDFTILDLRDAAMQAQKKNENLVRLSGRVVDKFGKPVFLAYVMVDSAPKFKDFPKYISAWTGNDGEYLLFLPPGRHYLGAETGFPPDSAYILHSELLLEKDHEGFDLILLEK